MTRTVRAAPTAEHRRLEEERERLLRWKHWGPYLSERAWGTVREDYSANGDAWAHFPHDHARSRAYRWSEDGLGGLCDRHQILCLAVAVWNEQDRDPEGAGLRPDRARGQPRRGRQGDLLLRGRDADLQLPALSLPVPAAAVIPTRRSWPPRATAASRTSARWISPISGPFDEDRYFDVFVEYAQAGPSDILMVITVVNRGPEAAPIHVLPHLWFRNTWSWTRASGSPVPRDPGAWRPTPVMSMLRAAHPAHGARHLYIEGSPELLFTNNETNREAALWRPFADTVRQGRVSSPGRPRRRDAGEPRASRHEGGGLASPRVPAGGSRRILLRLAPRAGGVRPSTARTSSWKRGARKRTSTISPSRALPCPTIAAPSTVRRRRGCSGRLQFYHYDVDTWLRGDAHAAARAAERPQRPLAARLRRRCPLHARQVGVPWFAAWDLAFHAVALASRRHRSRQGPAEDDGQGVVPAPERAAACLRVGVLGSEPARACLGDLPDLQDRAEAAGRGRSGVPGAGVPQAPHQLRLVGQQARRRGHNVFEGGFLGLDNISLFDRSERARRPGCAWSRRTPRRGWRCTASTSCASRWSSRSSNSAYEDLASKFFEHFLRIAHALHHAADGGCRSGPRRTGSTSTSSWPDGKPRHVQGPIDRRPHPALRGARDHAGGLSASSTNFRRRTEWFLAGTPHWPQAIAVRLRRPPGALARCRPGASSGCSRTCSTRTSSSRPSARARSPRSTRPRAVCALARATCAASTVGYEPGESTDAHEGRQLQLARAGLVPRSATCSTARCCGSSTASGTCSRIPSLGGRGRAHPARGRARIARAAWSRSSSAARMGGARVYGERASFSANLRFEDRLLFLRVLPRGHRAMGSGPRTRRGGPPSSSAEMVLRLARRARVQELGARADPCYEHGPVSLALGIALLALAVALGGLAAVFREPARWAMSAVRTFAVVAAAVDRAASPAPGRRSARSVARRCSRWPSSGFDRRRPCWSAPVARATLHGSPRRRRRRWRWGTPRWSRTRSARARRWRRSWLDSSRSLCRARDRCAHRARSPWWWPFQVLEVKADAGGKRAMKALHSRALRSPRWLAPSRRGRLDLAHRGDRAVVALRGGGPPLARALPRGRSQAAQRHLVSRAGEAMGRPARPFPGHDPPGSTRRNGCKIPVALQLAALSVLAGLILLRSYGPRRATERPH